MRHRLPFFCIGFCAAYATVYALQIPTGLYYPKLNEFHFVALTPRPGAFPVMLWFGWVLAGIAGGTVLSLLAPAKSLAKIGWTASWMAPALLLAYVVYHEYHWFLRG